MADPEGAGAAEWFVANGAQLAPLALEMILTSVATGGVGGAVSAGSRLGGRALAGAGIKTAERAGGKALAYRAKRALVKQRDGKDLNASDVAALRRVGQIAGAGVGAAAASYGVGIGDIYGEMEETGTSDRFLASLAAIPYAFMEFLPAKLAVTAVFRGLAGQAKKGNRLRRGATGAVVGGGVEGSTEGGQEIINLAVTDQLDFSNPEVWNRLTNAFAAGAGIGAPIGGVVNALPRTRGLDPVSEPDTSGADVADGADGADELLLTDRLPAPLQITDQRDILLDDMISGPKEITDQRGPVPLLEDSGTIYGEDGTLREVNAQMEARRKAMSQPDFDILAQESIEAAASDVQDIPGAIAQLDLGRSSQFPVNTPQGSLPLEGGTYQQELFPDAAPLPPEQEADPATGVFDNNQRTLQFPVTNQPDRSAGRQGSLPIQTPQPLPPIRPMGPQPDQSVLFSDVRPGPQLFSQDGEPMLSIPFLVESTGEQVSIPVPVREYIGEAKQRVEALENLRACLKG